MPDQLIAKGRGLELIDAATGHMLSHVPKYFTLATYHQRIGDDYNSADGTSWKPQINRQTSLTYHPNLDRISLHKTELVLSISYQNCHQA